MEELGYSERICFDLALARELNYYSGPIFDIYSSRSGKPLGGGGRYDGLLYKYGIFGQAIGFALDLETVASLSGFKEARPSSIMVWPGNLSPAETIDQADKLVSAHLEVEISWSSSGAESIQLARMRGIKWWIDLSQGLVINTGTDERSTLAAWVGGDVR
jgi:ATP phosphoribosyltransferase regulatory subunit